MSLQNILSVLSSSLHPVYSLDLYVLYFVLGPDFPKGMVDLYFAGSVPEAILLASPEQNKTLTCGDHFCPPFSSAVSIGVKVAVSSPGRGWQ